MANLERKFDLKIYGKKFDCREVLPQRPIGHLGGYCYYIHFNYEDRDGRIFICDAGCHIEWRGDGSWTFSQMIPENDFGKVRKLTNRQLKKVFKFVYEELICCSTS